MVRTSASLSLDIDSIPLSNSTTASLFKLHNKKDRVEKKLGISNAVSLGKLLNTSIFMRHTEGGGRGGSGSGSRFVVMAQFVYGHANKA